MVSTQVNIPGYQVNAELYDGSRTLVYRAVREIDSKSVIIKLLKNPYPSFSELVQFRNQYTIAKNLNFPGIIQTYSIEPYQNGYGLVMEDFGGISLKQDITIKQQSLIEFLQLAISLCDILDFLIRNRIIHKDIKPANILINTETKQVKLIDFSIASLLPRETQTLISPNILEGTLAYISPEQTGRMNRGIDYRTDFYSLGVTFYELLTGELPFQSNDAMELVHCHIAKTAPFVNEINLKIPAVISEIVSKLMAKNAEERYQSALGLKYDLEKCYLQLKETGAIEDFAIAQRDVSDRFIIPDKLYGRETEVETLLQAFDRVSTGTTEMMLVAGFSGIGKTAVVNEVHKPIVRQRGYFIKGKYDQFNRNIPFSAFVQAFRDLMGQLLTESDAQIQAWKSNILAALGENAQVIIEVIPELERIIGKQPPAVQLSGTAAQNRFNLLFQKFIQVFTTPEHPLVIFLDDLQWADSASLKLIQLLMGESQTNYLFTIGAYRDNEVFPTHPLILMLDEIRKTGAVINMIGLENLSKNSLTSLVTDTLNCHEKSAQTLADLIYQKTQGNPFFSTQFLKALHQDGLITFNHQGGWECDITQVREIALTDNVVEFMSAQLQKLSQTTQEILKLAACIGNQFDLSTLAIVAEKSEIATAGDLWTALQAGLVLPQTEIYKFYQGENKEQLGQENYTHKELAQYKFLHDRVQQAAYSLIGEDDKPQTHLKIGRTILAQTSPENRSERLFLLVNQFNLGRSLLENSQEQVLLAQLNLEAGRKAIASTAYEAAVDYSHIGIKLLPPDCWEQQEHLTRQLYQAAAQAACLCGQFPAMDLWIDTAIEHSPDFLTALPMQDIRLQAMKLQTRFKEALALGRSLLETLGITFPAQPQPQDIFVGLQEVQSLLAGRSIQDLVDTPPIEDPYKLAASYLLLRISPAAFLGEASLYPLLVLAQTKLGLESGHAAPHTHGYANYGILLSAIIGDKAAAYKFGQLALQLIDRYDARELAAMTRFLVNNFIFHWHCPVSELAAQLQKTYALAVEIGDYEHASYSAFNYCNMLYLAGADLATVSAQMEKYDQWIKVTGEAGISLIIHQVNYQTVLSLQGQIPAPTFPANWEQIDPHHPAFIYYIHNQLTYSYLINDYHTAQRIAPLLEGCEPVTRSMFVALVTEFYAVLADLALYPSTNPAEQLVVRDRIHTKLTQLQQWATQAPMNFQHKYELAAAQYQQILGEKKEAIELYDRAIYFAKENGFIQDEALANELAAKFYLDWGKEKVAAGYMQEAYYCYAKWGAKAKTDDLEKRYPQLLAPILQSATRSSHKETLTTIQDTVSHSSSSSSNFLDLDTILKISQSFTSEIHLERLVEQVMQAVVANAGADKGALILNHQDSLVVVCQYVNQQVYPFEIQPLDSCINLPLSIINYVKRTLELTIASVDIPQIFAADVYFSHHSPQSLLCTPILKQGQLIGLLYLENSLTCEVFTSERLEMLNLLCTQAAISLENASLYNTLEQKVIERTRELSQALNDLKAMQKKLVEAEKMAALGGLVAGVAHEINTPVGVGITLASTLVEQTKIFQDSIAQGQLKKSVLTSYLDTAAECSNLILTNLQRAGELIQSFKQVAVDQSNLEQRTIVIKSYVEEILTSMSPQLRQAGHNLTVTGDENIELYTYPGAIAQLLVNLLTNSLIHAYPDGNPGNLAIHISQVEQNVILTYSDDGCGIPREALGKIFEPFFTTARSRGGSGLGLHIVYNLVTQKLGGAIDVDSQLGEGTFFTITLPHSC